MTAKFPDSIRFLAAVLSMRIASFVFVSPAERSISLGDARVMTGRLAKLVLTLVLLTLLTTPAHATVVDFQTFDFTEFNLFASWAVRLADVLATVND